MIDINKNEVATNIQKLINKLFPIHRTLVNEGYKRSMEILQEELPFNVLEVPSGKQVFDWVVPKSWNVKGARIKNINGNILIDFKDNNLHLSAYSQAFNGRITHSELLKHINFREDLPNAIPYNFHYYKPHWSFNVSYHHFTEVFTEDEYDIEIETEVYDDVLQIGELYIEGSSKDEVLITTYMCHPSMVNDNLSGVVTSIELFKALFSQKKLKYSYRLVIIPETIGAISFLAEFPEKYDKVVAGLTVYCCGSGPDVIYKRSYKGDNYIDKVIEYISKKLYPSNFKIIPFWPGGSDERQFNGTGIRLPMGSVTRTPAAEFTEYHTSLDNLDLIQPSTLVNTLEKILTVINVVECDQLYKNQYKGEPCFSRHNIKYPTFNDALSKSAAYMVKILANEIDGINSLLDIALKWELNIFDLASLAIEFEKEQLIKATEND